jgi:hypothetical protein
MPTDEDLGLHRPLPLDPGRERAALTDPSDWH